MPTFSSRGKPSRLLLIAVVSACTGQPATTASTFSGTSPRPAASSSGSAAVTPRPAPAAPADPTLLITEPAVLTALEASGLSLTNLFGGRGDKSSNAELSKLPRFAALVSALEQEVRRAADEDKLAGVDVARYSHRLFDARFLRSAQASFRLAGVVNRPDRAAFAPGSCGEVRLIYRLSYDRGADRASKLPMTLGVEVSTPELGNGCRAWLQQWLEPAHADAAARAAWLRSAAGPLSNDDLALHEVGTRVVVNMQLVRYPATIRPDLGGHAEYLLRAFRPNQSAELAVDPLENTIDPQLFGGGPRQQQLVKWLGEHTAEVDAGTPLLPAALLTTRSLSVTPRGLARLANRPFTAALSPQLFKAGDFAAGKLVKSSQGLLRRLDQLSCQGCHESRSVAGFHLLGEDASDAPVENSLALPVSPHVLADLPRRLRIAKAILADQTPDLSVPLPERPAGDEGGYGSHCGLGSDPSFADWKCAPGLVCSAIEAAPGDPVGQCLPAAREVGDACETGNVRPKADRRYDRMGSVAVEECPHMVCNRSNVGFPAGMCTARCGSPGAVCGPIAVLDSFNACLARGESFLTCIRGNVNPAGLRGCDSTHACRDDYICARGQSGGVCLPPYFVFQLRVDGH